MFKFIKEAVQAVRAGNEYRERVYGRSETMAESYQRAKAYRLWEKENIKTKSRPFFLTNAQCREIESQKLQYQYWDCWTGGRFAREENPYINKDYYERNHRSSMVLSTTRYEDFIKHVKMGCVLRSNPVTGYWEPHTEHYDE